MPDSLKTPRGYLAIAIASMALLSSVGGNITLWRITSDNASLGAATRKAVCAFKADLQNRATQSLAYAAKHPNGIPSLGISAGFLVRQAIDEQQTADSLKIRC